MVHKPCLEVYIVNKIDMIRALIQVLEIDNFYGQTESIDIAKGKNEIPRGFKALKRSIITSKKRKK